MLLPRVRINILTFISTDIYLFDDPLSSLDVKVATSLMQGILDSDSLKDKTFLITSSNPCHIKYGDRIIYMDHGNVKYDGSYDDFIETEIYDDYIESSSESNDGSSSENESDHESSVSHIFILKFN